MDRQKCIGGKMTSFRAAFALAAVLAVAALSPSLASAAMIPLMIKDATGKPMSGDPVAGAVIFKQCGVCHVVTPGVNKVGPSLHGIIGRHSGSIPGFHYSAANKNSGIVWSEQEIFNYLQDPQKKVPGTFMTFTGVKDLQQRANVIAYLQENTK
jgi:cytochrome c